MKKVSVIVPIYNASEYLDRCLESIVNQTYNNLEILLIDDGSKDNSLEICRNWKNKDDRIFLFSQVNSGQASARNLGLKHATGQYISFIDSDDYVDKFMIEKMLYRMLKDNSNICCCGMNMVYRNGEEKRIYRSSKVINSKEAFEDLFNYNGSIIGFEVWNKLYDANIFENIKFNVGMLYEDAEINIRILENDYKISILDEPLYNYFQTEHSTMRKKFDVRDFDRIKVWKKAIYVATKKYPHCIVDAKIRKVRCDLYLLYKAAMNNLFVDSCIYSEMEEDIKSLPIFNIIKLRGYKEKFLFLLFKTNFNTVYKILKAVKK